MSLIFRFTALLTAFVASTIATQIKDVASVIGVRDNQLIGYGLVVGLNGSGDGSSSKFTIQSLSNMLQTVNVKINPDDIKSKNTAAVIVTAKLPAFARQGDQLDVTVSAIGDAKSLMGGTLLLTALKGVDGDIYALAQGALGLGGSVGKGGNHPTVGTIMEGAIVEREVTYDFASMTHINLSLKNSSFETAKKVQNTINSRYRNSTTAVDPRTLRVAKPAGVSMVDFVASVLDMDMDYRPASKVVIDERTGTIVSGIDVTVDPTIISHGKITLKIEPNSYAPQDPENPTPNLIDIGDQMSVNVGTNVVNIAKEKTTVANVARALNKLGASPKEIIAILENLKRAGAIHVPVEVI